MIFALAIATLLAVTQIPDPTIDPGAFGDLLSSLMSQAAWAPLIAVCVVGIVYALRRWGAGLWPWLATRRGALVMVLASAATGSVAVGLIAGQAVPAIVVQALVAALMAVGGHSGGKAAIAGGEATMIAHLDDGTPVEVLRHERVAVPKDYAQRPERYHITGADLRRGE